MANRAAAVKELYHDIFPFYEREKEHRNRYSEAIAISKSISMKTARTTAREKFSPQFLRVVSVFGVGIISLALSSIGFIVSQYYDYRHPAIVLGSIAALSSVIVFFALSASEEFEETWE